MKKIIIGIMTFGICLNSYAGIKSTLDFFEELNKSEKELIIYDKEYKECNIYKIENDKYIKYDVRNFLGELAFMRISELEDRLRLIYVSSDKDKDNIYFVFKIKRNGEVCDDGKCDY